MLGILGGTFDPVHFGHLRPALEIQQSLGLEAIRLIPGYVPPHRSEPHATPRQRLDMLQEAVAGDPAFTIDTREYEREGPSYTLDTLVSLRADLPDKALCLLVGTDAFCGFDSWHRWREILDYCHLVVMSRPGGELPREGELAEFVSQHQARDSEQLQRCDSGLLLFHPVTALAISATGIRGLLAAGKRADFLLPRRVLEVIHNEGLYTSGELNDA